VLELFVDNIDIIDSNQDIEVISTRDIECCFRFKQFIVDKIHKDILLKVLVFQKVEDDNSSIPLSDWEDIKGLNN